MKDKKNWLEGAFSGFAKINAKPKKQAKVDINPYISDPWPFPTSKKAIEYTWPFDEPKKPQDPNWEDKTVNLFAENNDAGIKFYTNPPQGAKTIVNSNGESDPNGKSLNSMGAKGDAGKDRVWLCLAGFSNALAQVAKVTTFGANKYTPNGWTEVPDAANRYMDAFGRHMLKLGSNEIIDKDSGTKHIAQMIWNLLAVLELEERAANPNTGKPWPKE